MKNIYNVYSIMLIFCVSAAIHGMKKDMVITKPVETFPFFTNISGDVQHSIFKYELLYACDWQEDLGLIAKRAEALQLVSKKNAELFSFKNVLSFLNITDAKKDLFLFHAAQAGVPCLVEWAINCHANVDFIENKGEYLTELPLFCGCTPLSSAVRKNNYKSCFHLLKAGANLEISEQSSDSVFFSPLYIAVVEKNVEIVKLLIAYNADVNNIGDFVFEYPLEAAIKGKDAAMIKLLIDNGAIIPKGYTKTVKTLLDAFRQNKTKRV